MKRRLFGFAVAVAGMLVAATAFAQSTGAEPNRGFMFQIGAGPSSISYGTLIDASFAAAQASGADRVQVYLNIDAGYALTQRLYLVAGVDGAGDRFYDATGAYVQLNSYLYHAGLRYYPFGTGLLFGIDGGASALLVQSNVGLAAGPTWGWGTGATIAYDFSKRATGFGLEVGLRVNYLSINASPITVAALYLDLLWK